MADAQYVDGVLKEWGDRLYYAKPKGRRARPAGFHYSPDATSLPAPHGGGRSPAANKQILARTVRKTPEVMVKISGGGKDRRQMKAHLDYISRNGELPLEDQDGNIVAGKQMVRELHQDWVDPNAGPRGQRYIPDTDGTRKEAFNIILSMPEGTDPEAVREAARAFAAATFADHRYTFALHTKDIDPTHKTNQPHVHLCVRAVDEHGHRLNPRKADLQQWRETFAENLRDRGIDANATKRAVRGQPHRGAKQAVYHIDKDHKRNPADRPHASRAYKAKSQAVRDEVQGTAPKRDHQGDRQLIVTRRDVVTAYGAIATALAASDRSEDKQLAVAIVEHVRSMEAPKSAHTLAVERGKQAGGEERAPTPEHVGPAPDRKPVKPDRHR